MKNLDTIKAKKAEIFASISKAIADGNEAAFAQAYEDMSNLIQESVMDEAKGLVQSNDNVILAGRGVRSLTSDEDKYYQAVIGAMKSANPRQALSDVAVTMPITVIEAVFEDLQAQHPLLDAVEFVNTSGMTEYLMNTANNNLATWDALCAEIVTEAVGGFKKVDLAHKKLSAFLPVCKAMLDLGPAWLDRYVRALLGEALYNGLEDGIIAGDGINEPIGMIRNLAAAVDPVTGYAAKAVIPISSLDAGTYGSLVAQLVVGPSGAKRVVNEVVLIVNPLDYYSKIMAATTQMVNGVYVRDIFPIKTTVIQSASIAVGKAILGLAKKYFMGIGTQKSGKIEYDDSYRFLEDERVYLVKLYGNGSPKDNNAYLYLDIEGLKPAIPEVAISSQLDARLASLTIGALTLTPSFNKSIFYYEATTANATNTITATAVDGTNATIAIDLNDGTVVANGAAATWSLGANTVEITVENGTETEVYTVIVTKTA
jgi:HK97 family phage major capsid protein